MYIIGIQLLLLCKIYCVLIFMTFLIEFILLDFWNLLIKSIILNVANILLNPYVNSDVTMFKKSCTTVCQVRTTVLRQAVHKRSSC